MYCYKTQLPEGLKNTSLSYSYQGIPNLKNIRLELAKNGRPLVIVLDDLLSGIHILNFFFFKRLNYYINFKTEYSTS